MKQAITLTVFVFAALEAGRAFVGLQTVVLVASGAIALVALMIAATFVWLWRLRATPLALGMAQSWLATAGFAGGWWAMRLAGRPAAPPDAPAPLLLGVLALFIVGALLHFAVIHRSFGGHGLRFAAPLLVAFALSAAVAALA